MKAKGIRGPLNGREISHLVRAGYLNRRVRCKPKGEASWRTIGDFFPLLKYGLGVYSLPPEDLKSGRRPALTLVVMAALVATGVYLYSNRSAFQSAEVNVSAKAPAPKAAPVTTASVLLLYGQAARDSAEASLLRSSNDRPVAPMALARGN